MKIKFFLSFSLLLLGVWLTAAYNHTVDLTSYRSTPAAKAPTVLSENSDADISQKNQAEVTLASQ